MPHQLHQPPQPGRLNHYQFLVLHACLRAEREGSVDAAPLSQRSLAAAAGISLGSVNKALKELRDQGLIAAAPSTAVTPAGVDALEPYRVRNAVILAAGMATRFAPLSFEMPKAMFEVRGEVLIERLIRQLQAAGITDITVVVGYMKESFFYLEDKFGVRIALNNEYATRNNHSSLHCVRDIIGNTYICNSDEYYTDNIFSSHVYRPYCSGCFGTDIKNEYVFTTDAANRITAVKKRGKNAYFSRGPAYFDRAFATQFMDIIAAEYDDHAMAGKLWDDVLKDHIAELEMYLMPYEPGAIYEFDYVTDLVEFDRDFFVNVDSRILDNICRTLDCTREDIGGVEPIKAGLTNLSVLFEVKGVKYVYRHPGNGTEEIINREAEAYALGIARDLGLDTTFVFEDPKEGWKISRYIEGCSELDYTDMAQVERALQMARQLHESGAHSPYSFDFYEEALNIVDLLRGMNYPLPRDFDQLLPRMQRIGEAMRAEAGAPVLCHNDFYGPNFLVKGDEMQLIDWEYAAMGDYACDLGNFVAQGSGYTVDQAIAVLDLYFGRKPTAAEERHCIAAIAIVGFYWYVWAMYKEAMGNPVGEWLYIWYKSAKQFGAVALDRYGIIG